MFQAILLIDIALADQIKHMFHIFHFQNYNMLTLISDSTTEFKDIWNIWFVNLVMRQVQ